MSPSDRYYKYYLVHETTPVRVTLDTRGLKYDAEAPDVQTGQLVHQTTMLSKIAVEWEVRAIDQAEFEQRCAEIYARRG